MRNVLEFNRARNEFALDEKLEGAMVVEEIQEFYNATNLAERVDAMIDVRYVYEGTQMKYNYNGVPINDEITKVVGQFHRLSTTMVADELGDDSQYLDKIMDKAWDIVCEINATKVAVLNANGKVMKQPNLRNATDEIATMLESVIG